MELAITWLSDISYMPELTPHPAYGRQALKANFRL